MIGWSFLDMHAHTYAAVQRGQQLQLSDTVLHIAKMYAKGVAWLQRSALKGSNVIFDLVSCTIVCGLALHILWILGSCKRLRGGSYSCLQKGQLPGSKKNCQSAIAKRWWTFVCELGWLRAGFEIYNQRSAVGWWFFLPMFASKRSSRDHGSCWPLPQDTWGDNGSLWRYFARFLAEI